MSDTPVPKDAPTGGLKRSRDDELLAVTNRAKSRKKLLDALTPFRRDYELEASLEVDQDSVGIIGYMEAGKFLACPLSTIQSLLEDDEIDMVDDSDIKSFSECEYGKISDFPMQCERLARKLIEVAELARAAGFADIKSSTLDVEDEDEDEENEDDDEEEPEVETDADE
jgi:hypothetical protein